MTETPTPHGGKKKRSRWDETPASQRMGGHTPLLSTPIVKTPIVGGNTPNFSGMTPGGMQWRVKDLRVNVNDVVCLCVVAGAMAMGLATPSPGQMGAMTPEQMQAWRWEKELDERNRPLTDEELDALFPQDGYKVTSSYIPIIPTVRHGTTKMKILKLSCFASKLQYH